MGRFRDHRSRNRPIGPALAAAGEVDEVAPGRLWGEAAATEEAAAAAEVAGAGQVVDREPEDLFQPPTGGVVAQQPEGATQLCRLPADALGEGIAARGPFRAPADLG